MTGPIRAERSLCLRGTVRGNAEALREGQRGHGVAVGLRVGGRREHGRGRKDGDNIGGAASAVEGMSEGLGWRRRRWGMALGP